MLSGFSKYRKVYAHLWRTYGASWKVRISYILQFLARFCALVVLPIAISLLITKLSSGDFAGARNAVLLYVSFSFTLGVITPLIKYVGMLGENKIYKTSTADYFSRLIATDLDYFHSNLSGYLTAATRQYVDSCVTLTRNIRDRYIKTVLSIVFPLIVIFWFDPWLGLVTLGLSLTQATYLLWASHAVNPFRSESRELYKRNSGRMADAISNILAIKATAQEKRAAARIKDGADEEAAAFTKRFTIQAKLIAVREFITVTFFLVLLWLTVSRMNAGYINITVAVLVITYINTILNGIYSLSEDLDEHDDLVDKIIPAFEILERENAIKDPDHPKKLDDVHGEIAFSDVTFSYHKQDDAQAVFRNFSLVIPRGQKVGVVGLSGAGKSTLTKLLMRFDDVDAGEITIDGIDVRDVKQFELRRNIAYVPQEPLLLHAPIKDNVLLAKPDASEKEIQNALKAAHASGFVEQLPEGIQSVVGERGVKLSGGQKQRIAIARAVLQQAPIMILDEATSALDSESEQIIKDSFAEILKGKTAIVVAHRLSTLSEMDRIIVIDHGTLLEDGTHESLIRQNGVYARLWRRQQKHLDVDEI